MARILSLIGGIGDVTTTPVFQPYPVYPTVKRTAVPVTSVKRAVSCFISTKTTTCLEAGKQFILSDRQFYD